jgi:hypothetical protein
MYVSAKSADILVSGRRVADMSPTNPTSLSESDRYDPVLFGPKKKRRRRKRKKIQYHIS